MKTNSSKGKGFSGRFLEKKSPLSVKYIFLYIFSLSVCQFLSLLSHSQNFKKEKTANNLSQITPDVEKNVRNTLKQNSLRFQLIENIGQLGLPSKVVAYFSTRTETVFIEKDCLRIVVTEPGTDKKVPVTEKNDVSRLALLEKEYHYNSFTVQFSGSDGFKSYEKKNRFETERNYFNMSANGGPAIKAESYGEIILKNIYQGIDLRLYSQENGKLEFDWIAWPGADPDQIRMKFIGQKELGLSEKGELLISLGLGVFNMRLPESYYVTPEGKVPTHVQFALANNHEVHFKGTQKWLNKYPLVIDPDLLWGTFVDGGSSNYDEYLYAIQYDYSTELLYCAGAINIQVSNLYEAALSGAYDGSFEGVTDAIVYALTKNGQTIRFVTYFGGTDGDLAIGLSISSSFIYICGYTSSADFPVTKLADGAFPAFDSVYHGNTDGFIAVFNLRLDNLAYSSFLGGAQSDEALTIRATADSSFYVSLVVSDVLSTTGPDYLLNSADNVYGGTSEAWIGKFTSFHTLSFGTYVGGNSSDLVNDFQLLSSGDVVFTGNTRNINEVNATIPDNGTGQEALFGKLHVPLLGPVNFDIVDKMGGAGSDFGWGIYSLGDSVSVVVGETNSNDFPLGTGTPFQPTRNGNIDGFMAKIYNDGSAGYKATFMGGFDDDILVSVRPVVVNNQIALLSFGSTLSMDLATRNFNSGTFFSPNNSGNHDMVFVICDLDLTTEYYLSYIGGSADDYLGKTGAPFGSNHLFYNSNDSVLYLGTTTHSFQMTQAPSFVGRGISDVDNLSNPVFDEAKGNGINDTHVIVAISTRSLFFVLPISWLKFESSLLSDCSRQLEWSVANEEKVARYSVERSSDGKNYQYLGSLPPGSSAYQFTDGAPLNSNEIIYYRIRADYLDGKQEFSAVHSLRPCHQQPSSINIYPTVTSDYFTISGLESSSNKTIHVSMFDGSGKKMLSRQVSTGYGPQSVYFEKTLARGAYLVLLKDGDTEKVLKTQTIIVNYR